MALPVAGADLVADQRVAGRAIGYAQQRLGQAHQGHALLAGERVFLQQRLHNAARAFGAQLHHQVFRRLARRRRLFFGQGGMGDEGRDAILLRPAISGGDRGAQHGLRLHILREIEKRHEHRGIIVRCRRLGFSVPGSGVQALATLKPLQPGQDHLFDDPMRGARLCFRHGLQPQANMLVQFHADRGGSHGALQRLL